MKIIFTLLLIAVISLSAKTQIYERTDTLMIPITENFPVIDGTIEEAIWDLAEWQPIDQVWMPYDNNAGNISDGLKVWDGDNDFKGSFKVVWSPESNLLYFLVKSIDDVFVDEYQYSENPSSGGGYPNYDIVEIFIDENRSGGLHVFDGTGSTATNWGTNAENAFSYHIAADKPEDGSVQDLFYALDIAGSNWGYPKQKVAEYSGHFPEFAMVNNDSLYIWEFSLKVYNDTYNDSNPDASLVNLSAGKVMGLSVAYCDNDSKDESPLKRDHFFGSVYVPQSAYNDHWMQANWFGVAKLEGNNSTPAEIVTSDNTVRIKSYATRDRIHTTVSSPQNGKVTIRIFNVLGTKILEKTEYKGAPAWETSFSTGQLQNGIYLVEVTHNNLRNTGKVIVNR